MLTVRKGVKKLCIRTVDTDVVVIAIAMFRQINLDTSFEIGSNLRYIPVHEVAAEMDQQVCATLPVWFNLL